MWFKHDVLAHKDKKLRAVRAKYGLAGYGLYFLILELMGYDDDGYLDYDIRALSLDLGLRTKREREMLQYIIVESGLFEVSEDRKQFYSLRFLDCFDEVVDEVSYEEPTSSKRKYNLSAEGRERLRIVAEKARNAKEILEMNPNNPKSNPKEILEMNPNNPKSNAKEILEMNPNNPKSNPKEILEANPNNPKSNPKEILENGGGIIRGGDNKSLSVVESIEGVYPENIPTTQETKTRKKKTSKKERSEVCEFSITGLKGIFEQYYAFKTNGLEFYWDGKQCKALKELQGKLELAIRNRGLEVNEETLSASFISFLKAIQDDWILENLSVAILNTKYNEIRTQYANNGSGTKAKAGASSKAEGYDAIRNALRAAQG